MSRSEAIDPLLWQPGEPAHDRGPSTNGIATKAAPPPPAVARGIAGEWSAGAYDLADWTQANLVARTDVYGSHKRDGSRITKEGLTREILVGHFAAPSPVEVAGLHTTVVVDRRDLARFGVADYDRHGDQGDGDANFRAALAHYRRLRALEIAAWLEDSNGRGGYHVWAIFDALTTNASVRGLLLWLVSDWESHGLTAAPETFPKQASIKGRGKECGNWVRLPGPHPKSPHYSRLWDDDAGRWLEGRAAIAAMLATVPGPASAIPAEAAAFVETPTRRAAKGKKAAAKKAKAEKAGTVDAYVRSALDDELARLAASPQGDRNQQLNRSAFALGQLVGAGVLTRAEAEAMLAAVARRIGLEDAEIAATIASGLDAGERQPRDLSAVGGKGRDGTAGGGGWAGSDGDEIHEANARRPRTDSGNAERLVSHFGDRIRYCHPWGKCLVWDGRRWAIDNTAEAKRMAKATARRIMAEAGTIEDDDDEFKAHVAFARQSESKARLEAMLVLAAAEPEIPVVPDELDADPWLLNCLNGTIDLRAGNLRPHDPGDLITKLCPVPFDPAAECPLWIETLRLFFADNVDLIRYWQRLVGYCLTGVIRDHILPIAHGAGSNGKSTILGTLLNLFGTDYAIKAPPDFLMARSGEAHPTDRADLFGRRLVVAVETEEGRRLNESLIKELTGGDRIRARRMREDFWEFSPSHKVMMATNHKPAIRGTDHGIWRRVRLIPFAVTMADDQADKGMPARLLAELPGILRWAVDGCLDWQANGLPSPEGVAAATREYRDAEDVLGAFMADCCLPPDPDLSVRARDFYESYQCWAEAAGENPLSLKRIGKAVEERGIRKNTSNGTWYHGIGLRDDAPKKPRGKD